MSKSEKEKAEKVVKAFDSEPLLDDLAFRDLLLKYRRLDKKQKEHESDIKDLKEQKTPVGAEIQEAIKAINADIVTGVPVARGETARVTLVKFEASESLNEDKLRENLMKIAKLDIVLIEKIWKASLDKIPAKASYIKVTAE